MHDGVAQIHAAVNCNPPELAVAALSAGSKNDTLRMSRSMSQVASLLAASEESGSSLTVSLKNFSSYPGPQRPPDSSFATSVLRI
jgi:hypothetical protein